MAQRVQVIAFKELLEWGGQLGLQSISTECLQRPEKVEGTSENNIKWTGYALFRATVTRRDGAIFVGHGDACQANIRAAMAPSLIRMAETRAIGRALRWMTGCGVVCEVEFDKPPENPIRVSAPREAGAQPAGVPGRGDGHRGDSHDESEGATDEIELLSDAQQTIIRNQAAQLGYDCPNEMSRMTRGDANLLINAWKLEIKEASEQPARASRAQTAPSASVPAQMDAQDPENPANWPAKRLEDYCRKALVNQGMKGVEIGPLFRERIDCHRNGERKDALLDLYNEIEARYIARNHQ